MEHAEGRPLTDDELQGLDAYWRAANYLSVGQIYLLANPLLAEPLRPEHIKPRLLGHWGTTPGLNLVYAHLNRVIRERQRELMYVIGPGHGGPAIVANSWLEGSWTATYPETTRDGPGMARLFKQFSFPGGIPSHVAPEVPGSIHEGGELGYSLSHAYGAAFDNPRLVVACVVGDGEAETGPLATSWHSNKFLDPRRDGAVLPILHLNGYKIANPTVLARIGDEELTALLRGYGHEPYLVEGSEPAEVHQALAAAMDRCFERIDEIQLEARTADAAPPRQAWPMIVLRTPKGWTGPHTVDGLPVEDTWRSHQVPLSGVRTNEDHLRQLEDWLRSYRPEELFDGDGRPTPGLIELAPGPELRMGSSPHANGGLITRDLELPAVAEYAVPVKSPGAEDGEPTKVLPHVGPRRRNGQSPDALHVSCRRWLAGALVDVPRTCRTRASDARLVVRAESQACRQRGDEIVHGPAAVSRTSASQPSMSTVLQRAIDSSSGRV